MTNNTAKNMTKAAAVDKLLRRTRGATPAELQAATGWQPHSVRAFLSGLRKRGAALLREERPNGELAYVIRKAAEQQPQHAASEAEA